MRRALFGIFEFVLLVLYWAASYSVCWPQSSDKVDGRSRGGVEWRVNVKCKRWKRDGQLLLRSALPGPSSTLRTGIPSDTAAPCIRLYQYIRCQRNFAVVLTTIFGEGAIVYHLILVCWKHQLALSQLRIYWNTFINRWCLPTSCLVSKD